MKQNKEVQCRSSNWSSCKHTHICQVNNNQKENRNAKSVALKISFAKSIEGSQPCEFVWHSFGVSAVLTMDIAAVYNISNLPLIPCCWILIFQKNEKTVKIAEMSFWSFKTIFLKANLWMWPQRNVKVLVLDFRVLILFWIYLNLSLKVELLVCSRTTCSKKLRGLATRSFAAYLSFNQKLPRCHFPNIEIAPFLAFLFGSIRI